MNNRIKGGLMRLLPAVLIASFALTACAFDPRIDTPSVEDGEATVKFSVYLPTGSGTRALSESNENHVQTIDILLFGQNGGEWVYKVGNSGSGITTDNTNSSKKSFTVKMRYGDYDAVMFANARDVIAGLDMTGMTKSEVLAVLNSELPSGGKWLADAAATGYRHIPMWSEVGNLSIAGDTEIKETAGITLTRMLARVDVNITDAAASSFTITSVDVYNYNTKGSVVPKAAGWDTQYMKATAPNVPASSTLTLGPAEYGGDEIDGTNNLCASEIYIFEAENHTDATHEAGKEHTARTCIVVGGEYGPEKTPSFYRADFSTGTGESEVFLDVLRNHHYTFNVTGVSGPGYGTSEEAFYGDRQIEFTVTVTDWGAHFDIPLHWKLRGMSNSYMVDKNDPNPFVIPAGQQIAYALSASDTRESGRLPKGWMDNRANLKAAVLWSDVNDFASDNAVVRRVSYVGRENLADCRFIVYPGKGVGNSLVILYDDVDGDDAYTAAVDEIKWSWHIWNAGGYFPYDSAGNATDLWMDRNMGATSNMPGNVATMGFYYQWGRKDPFPGAKDFYDATGGDTKNTYFAPEHKNVAFDTRNIHWEPTMPDENDGLNNMSTATKNPTVRYRDTMTGDWYAGTYAYQVANLWGGEGDSAYLYDTNGKSVYDPCPEGYRVPKKDDLTVTGWQDFNNEGWINDNYGGYYPATGTYLVAGGNDAVWMVKGFAYYWTATGEDTGSQYTSYLLYTAPNSSAFQLLDHPRTYGCAVRCIKDELTPTDKPVLTTDADGKVIMADGGTLNIAVTSNTEWEVSVRRGTNEVTIGNASMFGKPIISALNGGPVTAYVSGDGNGAITVTTVNYTNPYKKATGSFVLVFRDKATGILLHTATITTKVPEYIAPRFAKSNIVLYIDGDGNRILTFAETEADFTRKTVRYENKADKTPRSFTLDGTTAPKLTANVQGIHFRWGGLVGLSSTCTATLLTAFNGAKDIQFWPVEYEDAYYAANGKYPSAVTWKHNTKAAQWQDPTQVPYLGDQTITTTAKTYDAFEDYFDQAYFDDKGESTATIGYDAKAGYGDICRYMSAKGWVKGNWRMPTRRELELLYSETTAIGTIDDGLGNMQYGVMYGTYLSDINWNYLAMTNPDATYTDYYGFTPVANARMLGGGITAADRENPDYLTKGGEARVVLPAAGYRIQSYGYQYEPGSRGGYWASSSGNATNGSQLDVLGSGAHTNAASARSYGFSVRCILEE